MFTVILNVKAVLPPVTGKSLHFLDIDSKTTTSVSQLVIWLWWFPCSGKSHLEDIKCGRARSGVRRLICSLSLKWGLCFPHPVSLLWDVWNSFGQWGDVCHFQSRHGLYVDLHILSSLSVVSMGTLEVDCRRWQWHEMSKLGPWTTLWGQLLDQDYPLLDFNAKREAFI